jgi:hypothetical protein
LINFIIPDIVPIPALGFSDDGPVLDSIEGESVSLDPDTFITDLKNLHPNFWEPLPCNIM